MNWENCTIDAMRHLNRLLGMTLSQENQDLELRGTRSSRCA